MICNTMSAVLITYFMHGGGLLLASVGLLSHHAEIPKKKINSSLGNKVMQFCTLTIHQNVREEI